MDMSQRISNIAAQIDPLPSRDRDSISDFLAHNEWGVALESLIGGLLEEQIKISRAIYDEIKAVGHDMKMDSSAWEDLKPLIV